MSRDIATILKLSKLSVTDARKFILNLFLQQEGALAHSDIEKAANSALDRVTVYRTLQTFVEKGIIHIIPTEDNSIRYAICQGECSEGHHHDNHVHFQCSVCGATQCLTTVHVPQVSLPVGFESEDVEIIVKGVCNKCNIGN